MPAKGHFGCSADKQDGSGRLLYYQTDARGAIPEPARGAREGVASFHKAARPQTKSQKKITMHFKARLKIAFPSPLEKKNTHLSLNHSKSLLFF